MERLTIDELIAHCDRQLDRLPSGNKTYQEHESVRAYLQMLRHYMDTGLTPEHAAELAQAEKDGRVMVLPPATDGNGALYALYQDGKVVERYVGNSGRALTLLSCLASLVAEMMGVDYHILLLAMASCNSIEEDAKAARGKEATHD